MSYDVLLAHVELFTGHGGGVLWIRCMVLGPTPEFWLEVLGAVVLPQGLKKQGVSLRPVWPS